MPSRHFAPLAGSIPVLLVVWGWGFFLLFFKFFFLLIHSEQNTLQCCQKHWSRQLPVLFFQLKGIITVTNSFTLCISFMLTPPNEQRYLIYSLLCGFKVIDYNSCSGSDIQPYTVVHIPCEVFQGEYQHSCMFLRKIFPNIYKNSGQKFFALFPVHLYATNLHRAD